MILLTVQGVRKYFGPEPVLAGVTFDVRRGDKVSLVGPNGTGKTTLLRIVAGDESADAGTVDLHSSARLGYLRQQQEFAVDRTVWEEAASALDSLREMAVEVEQLAEALARATDDAERKRIGARYDRLQHELDRHEAYHLDHRIERVLTGLGFPTSMFNQPVRLLSGGQQSRLMTAKLLLEEPDIMLLDEPSNHLDIDATEWLEGFLAASQSAVMVVSHDRYFLDKVSTRTIELFQGSIEVYPGNFSAYQRLKRERLEVQRRTFEKQQQEIEKMEDFVRRNLSGQKHAQAEDRRKKLERIERVAPPREIAPPPMGFAPPARTGDVVLRLERVTKGFERPLFRDLSFDIQRGEKWGVLGPNGCGKTTLLKCLRNHLQLDAGRFVYGANVRVGYFDQHLAELDDKTLVVDAVRPDHKDFVEQQRRDLLARFGVTGDMVHQRVASLSGGERNRVALARLAALDANFLILDEPTNHLDLWSRDALERALRDFDGTVLFVSHDRYFLNRVADHLLVVEPGRFRTIEGNYETYLHLIRAGLAAEARPDRNETRNRPASSPPSPAARRENEPKSKPKRRFPYRKLTDLEAEIEQREQQITDLHAALANPEVLRNGERIRQVKKELELEQERLAQLIEHWEEALELQDR